MKRIILSFYVVFSMVHIMVTSTATCPCIFPKEFAAPLFVVCHNSAALFDALQSTPKTTQVLLNATDDHTLVNNRCSVFLSVESVDIQQTTQRRICPDTCAPVPIAKFPSQLLQKGTSFEVLNEYRDYPITCSLTVGMSTKQQLDLGGTAQAAILELVTEVARRLVMECDEHAHRTIRGILPGSNHTPHVRRKVFAVIIWVGAASNVKLIWNQALMLTEAPFHGTQGVVAWAATDYLYGCTKEETTCKGHLGRYKYLPHSSLNLMSVGWKCAQRRPLRALAHVLALYDPEFIVSLDDDSFFNYPLLMKRYGSYILSTMHQEPLVLGEFEGRTGPAGHLTTKGIFAGGSGYIMGHKILSRLHRNEVYAVGSEMWSDVAGATRNEHLLDVHADSTRSKEQLRFLSVLGEGVNTAVHACPSLPSASSAVSNVHSNTQFQRTESTKQAAQADLSTNQNTCILSLKPRSPPHRASLQEKNYQTVPIGVRLVDFCTNLMANANTCQHSDHSLGRCLIYGAHATPIGFTCHTLVPLHEVPASVPIGLCFSALGCNITEQITCHRHKVGWSGRGKSAVITPVRTTNRKAFYKWYSSVYDGNTTETNGR